MAITIGFYKKALLFWVIVTVLIFVVVIGWQRYLAHDRTFSLGKNFGSKLSLNVEMDKNGSVRINGDRVGDTIFPTKKFDQFRLKILDEVPQEFSEVTVRLNLPKPVDFKTVNARGLLIHSFSNTVNIASPDERTIIFKTAEVSPNAVFTVTIDLPKGYLAFSPALFLRSFLTTVPASLWLGAGLLFPLLTLALLLIQLYKRLTFLWQTRNVTLVSNLPQDVPPAVVGAIHHGIISPREIAATIVDLAVSRKLTIFAKDEGDFTFARTPLEPSRGFEKVLISKLFYSQQIFSHRADVLYRVGHRIFSQKIADVYWQIYRQLELGGYFLEPPGKVIFRWRSLAVSLFFVGVIGFFTGVLYFPEPKFPLFLWLGVIIGSLLIDNFSYLMNNFSPRGLQALRDWAGFKKYLSLPEPISYQEAIDGRFGRFLPYALVLGVERKWLARFQDHPFTPPVWFDAQEPVITLETFSRIILPIGGYVARLLAESRAPTV